MYSILRLTWTLKPFNSLQSWTVNTEGIPIDISLRASSPCTEPASTDIASIRSRRHRYHTQTLVDASRKLTSCPLISIMRLYTQSLFASAFGL